MQSVDIVSWIQSLPIELVYIVVFMVVGIESLGIPLPGELTLTTASILASHGILTPWLIWLAGAAGAITGDSIGYFFGHHFGRRLLIRLGQRFPRHINPRSIKLAEKAFHRYGVKTVFFGRFIAILRIFAGPLAGILKMPYKQFLIANAAGGIVWSGTVVWTVYFAGVIAEHWLQRLSWVALVASLIIGSAASIFFHNKIEEFLRRDGK